MFWSIRINGQPFSSWKSSSRKRTFLNRGKSTHLRKPKHFDLETMQGDKKAERGMMSNVCPPQRVETWPVTFFKPWNVPDIGYKTTDVIFHSLTCTLLSKTMGEICHSLALYKIRSLWGIEANSKVPIDYRNFPNISIFIDMPSILQSFMCI